MAKDTTDKINSLKRYIETVERQLQTPPKKYLTSNATREAYEYWANLELTRTKADIEKLKAV